MCQLDLRPLSRVAAAYDIVQAKMCPTCRFSSQLGFFFSINLFYFLWKPVLNFCLSWTSISPSEPSIYLVLCPHRSRRGQATRLYEPLKMFNCCADRLRCFTEGKVEGKERGLQEQDMDFRKKMWKGAGKKPRRCTEAGLGLPKQRRFFCNCQTVSFQEDGRNYIFPRACGERQ